MTMIYVGNLSDDTDAAGMRILFERYGAIASLRMTPGDSGHRFGSYGSIEMKESSARKAIAELDGRVLDGAIVSVRESAESQSPNAGPVPTPSTGDEKPARVSVRRHIEVIEVKKVNGPGGADGEDWYRYVLARGPSRITGFHRGTLAEVTEYAAESVAAFNERGLRGKSILAWAWQRKK